MPAEKKVLALYINLSVKEWRKKKSWILLGKFFVEAEIAMRFRQIVHLFFMNSQNYYYSLVCRPLKENVQAPSTYLAQEQNNNKQF